MKVLPIPTSSVLFFALASLCPAQVNPIPKNATAAVLKAFEAHDIVMLGEIHGNKQEYEWLDSLVSDPEFADRVDDIVTEFGNSLYQKSVDPLHRAAGGGGNWTTCTPAIGHSAPLLQARLTVDRYAGILGIGKCG